MRIVALGGTGAVGRHVVDAATAGGHTVVVATRTGTAPIGSTAARADASSGEGLTAAFAGADLVIDTTNVTARRTKATPQLFTTMAERVSAAAAQAGVQRVLLLSIVGIDAFPDGYYRGKAAQEQAYRAGATPVTILRSTQFHEFVSQILTSLPIVPVRVVPRMRIQPVAARDVAAALVEAAEGPAVERVPDLAGPQVRELADLAKALLKAGKSPAAVFSLRLPGQSGRLMADGALLATSGRRSSLSFDDWLVQQ